MHSAYVPVGEEVVAPVPRPRASRLQWCCLLLLTFAAGVLLSGDVKRNWGSIKNNYRPSDAAAAVGGGGGNSTVGPKRRRTKRWIGVSMGRTGTSPGWFQRVNKRSVKKRVIILVGSQAPVGGRLAEAVFADLCAKPRLGLKCDGLNGPHDAKALGAAAKGRGKKRLVWLERDAARLRATWRRIRARGGLQVRVVHLLLDPMAACVAQWGRSDTNGGNASLASACRALALEEVGPLYRRAKREPSRRALQLKLEALAGTSGAKGGAANWRHLFRFLELKEKDADLSTQAMAHAAALELRKHVLNVDAPGWVRPAIARNASLAGWVRKMQADQGYSALTPPTAHSVAAAALGRA